MVIIIQYHVHLLRSVIEKNMQPNLLLPAWRELYFASHTLQQAPDTHMLKNIAERSSADYLHPQEQELNLAAWDHVGFPK